MTTANPETRPQAYDSRNRPEPGQPVWAPTGIGWTAATVTRLTPTRAHVQLHGRERDRFGVRRLEELVPRSPTMHGHDRPEARPRRPDAAAVKAEREPIKVPREVPPSPFLQAPTPLSLPESVDLALDLVQQLDAGHVLPQRQAAVFADLLQALEQAQALIQSGAVVPEDVAADAAAKLEGLDEGARTCRIPVRWLQCLAGGEP